MPCQRCLNCYVGGEKIPDFTNDNNIRVLSDNVPERFFKGQVQLGIDGTLGDSVDDILNRVFGSDDTVFRGVQMVDATVYSGCLSGAGGACYNQNTAGRFK